MSDVIDFEAAKRKRAQTERGLFAYFPGSSAEIDEDVLCALSDPCNESDSGERAVGIFSAGLVDGEPSDGWCLTPDDARRLAERLVVWAAWCERGFPGETPEERMTFRLATPEEAAAPLPGARFIADDDGGEGPGAA